MTTEAGTPWRGWLGPLLVASLMINFLVFGVMAGAFVTGRGGHGWLGREHRGVTGFVERLPGERRRELKALLDARLADLEPLWTEQREARRAVMASVAAEPFDRAKLEAELAKFGEIDKRVREGRSRKFADVVTAMTAEERRAFHEWRQKQRQDWRPGTARHHGGGEKESKE